MDAIEYLKEAQKWLAKAQHGDPNGGKAYQASKYVGYALQKLEAAQQGVQSDNNRREQTWRCPKCGAEMFVSVDICGCGYCR